MATNSSAAIALARYFHRKPPGQIQRLRDLGPPAVLVAIPVGLILLQRDLGVALLTLLIATIYLPFVHIPWRAWAAVAAAGAAAAAWLWSSFLQPHQRGRGWALAERNGIKDARKSRTNMTDFLLDCREHMSEIGLRGRR